MASINKIASPFPREPQTKPFQSSVLKVTENDDLLTLILSRLPAKSVIRFKSVCKHWLSLVSHPSFSLLHTIHSPSPIPSGIFFPHPNNESKFHYLPLYTCTRENPNSISPPFTSLNFTDDPFGEIEILQSCNGLLLCASTIPWDGIEARNYYIFNPTTKQFSIVPPPPREKEHSHVSLSIFSRISLAFDPSKSPHYKVVLVRKADGCLNIFQFEVYSSKTRKWRLCGDHVEWPSFEVFSKGVYWNRATHWASKRDGSVCFDVDLECLKTMPPLPPFRDLTNGACTVRYLDESGGHLYLIDAQVSDMNVFEMEDDYSSWIFKFHIDVKCTLNMYPRIFSPSRDHFISDKCDYLISSIIHEEKDEDVRLVLCFPGKIVSYNVEDDTIEVIQDAFFENVDKTIPALLRGFRGYQYFQSLACV